ncbi:MAG: lysylphosphatidylglycerol synthase transmembrane domain-containing protein [Flammeovirgaceae bacterium]
MDKKSSKALESLKPSRVIIPIIIGLGVVVWMFVTDEEMKWEQVVHDIKNANIAWIALAIVALFARDIGYIYRIRYLTNKELSWISSIYVIILWEFASALTPSVVGGTAVVAFIISKENIPFGKSLAYVMLTAVLDNLFFVVASLTVILLQVDAFPSIKLDMIGVDGVLPVENIFIISVSLIALYTFLMVFGIFGKPQAVKWLFAKVTANRFLRRFHKAAVKSGDDIILASSQLKGMDLKYWIRAIMSTIFIWSARYLIVNFFIAAFSDVNFTDHIIIFARHLIMWIVMLLSPTPGGAGFAEGAFPTFFEDFTGPSATAHATAVTIALTWRLLTYYLYLILGVIFLPRWVARVFKVKPKAHEDDHHAADQQDESPSSEEKG